MDRKDMSKSSTHEVTIWHIIVFLVVAVLFISNVALVRSVQELTAQHNEVLDYVDTAYNLIYAVNHKVESIEPPQAPKSEPNKILHQVLVNLYEELKILSDKLSELEERIDPIEEIWQELEFDRFIATAYSPFDNVSGIENDGNPWSTSTGSVPDWGTFAVCPKTIPYYSTVLVIGKDWFEWGKALDTGGTMRKHGTWIDLYRDTYKQTLQFGLQRNTIVIWR